MSVIQNAIVTYVEIRNDDHGVLTAYLGLDYGGAVQGFGGFALYLPKSFTHHSLLSVAGHFVFRCMQIADVNEWTDIKGKAIRVELTEPGFGAGVIAIGHIIKDDWFNPNADFAVAHNYLVPGAE